MGIRNLRLLGAPIAAALAALMLSPALTAQGKLDREVRFVRALATSMRLQDLSRREIERLQASFKDASQQDVISQLAVEVALIGAKSEADRSKQRAHFKAAIEQCQALLDRSSDANVLRGARTTLADAAQEFGQFLIEEIEIARTENPDAVKGLEEEAANVFRAGIESCNKVMSELEPQKRNEQKKIEHGVAWLRKGVLQRENARAVKSEAGHLVASARKSLEDMVLEIGPETALGLRGMFELAQCDEVDGNIKGAIEMFGDTVGQIRTALEEADKGDLVLSAEMRGFLLDMMQEVFSHQSELMLKVGDTAAAEALFAEFRAQLKKYGDPDAKLIEVAHSRFGHMTLLTEAKLNAESGNPDRVKAALEICQEINDLHPADFVGIRAKRVLSEILAAQKSLVSGALLFEVAKGKFQDKELEPAIIDLRRAVEAMSDTEQKQLGLEVYDMLGRAFGLSERYIECVLALTEGLNRFGAHDATKSADVADRLDRAMQILKQASKADPLFDGLLAGAQVQIEKWGGASVGDKLHWKKAEQAIREGRPAEAAASYAQITPDYVNYEMARARMATALRMAGDYAGARKAVADYREWLSQNQAAANQPTRKSVREVAMTEADYVEVSTAYLEVIGDEKTGRKPDPTKYPAVIEQLRAFIANHQKDGDQMLVYALDNLGQLQVRVGDIDQAEQTFVQLRERDPQARYSAGLASVIFLDYRRQVDAMAAERAAANGNTAELDARLTQLRRKMIAIGQEYIRSAPQPQIGIMVHTMNQLEAIKDWPRVSDLATQIMQKFGADKDPAVKEIVDRSVLPKIGEALLMQREYQRAYDMLVEAEKANPNLYELKRLIALALGGWVEVDARGGARSVPGLDKPVEAYKKYYAEYRQWATRAEVGQYTLPWYKFQWEAYWFARQAAVKDSTYGNYAKSLWAAARSTDDFASLRALGQEGRDLDYFFQHFKPPQ